MFEGEGGDENGMFSAGEERREAEEEEEEECVVHVKLAGFVTGRLVLGANVCVYIYNLRVENITNLKI